MSGQATQLLFARSYTSLKKAPKTFSRRVFNIFSSRTSEEQWSELTIGDIPSLFMKVWKDRLSLGDRLSILVWLTCSGFLLLISACAFVYLFVHLAYIMFWWPVVIFIYPLVYLKHPDLVGFLLTWILSRMVLYHPLVFDRIYLLPSYSNGIVCLRVEVENFGFGNPPGYPHEHFIQAKSVLVMLSCHYRDLLNVHGLFLPSRYHCIKPMLNVVKNKRYHPVGNAAKSHCSRVSEEIEDADEAVARAVSSNSTRKNKHSWRNPFSYQNKHKGNLRRKSIAQIQQTLQGPVELEVKLGNDLVAVRTYTTEDIVTIIKLQRMLRRAKIRAQLEEVIKGRWGVLYVERLEFNEVLLNFEMFSGMLNIKGFSRDLAIGELRRSGALKPEEKMPNCLKVRLIRCRNLKAMDFLKAGRPTSDPYVRVKARTQEFVTHTHMKTCNPMFNEVFHLHCSDPSTVLHMNVMDEDVGKDDFLGQWLCTVKYLKNKPTGPDWFPLRRKNFEPEGCGDIEMEVSWEYVEGFDLGYEEPKLTALQQLQENSDETNLRMGSATKVISMLKRFPFLLDVELVVFRNITFLMRDLFAGYEGALEKKSTLLTPKQLNSGKVHVPMLQLTNKDVYKLRYKQGHTIWGFLLLLCQGVVPKVLSMHVATKGISAIAQGLFTNVRSDFISNFGKGIFKQKAKGKEPAPITQDSGPKAQSPVEVNLVVATSTPTSPVHISETPTKKSICRSKKGSNFDQICRQMQNFFGKKTGGNVQADDEDFLLDPTLSGLVEMYKAWGNKMWKERRLEIKGNSVYYTKFIDGEVEWTRKLGMERCTKIVAVPASLTSPCMIALTMHIPSKKEDSMLYFRCKHDFLKELACKVRSSVVSAAESAQVSLQIQYPPKVPKTPLTLAPRKNRNKKEDDGELLRVWEIKLNEVWEASKILTKNP